MVKVGGKKDKEFGGLTYYQYHVYENKWDATYIADRLRMRGYLARVVPIDDSLPWWMVYRRKVSEVTPLKYIENLARYCRFWFKQSKTNGKYQITTPFTQYQNLPPHEVNTLKEAERVIIQEYRRLYPKFPKCRILG
jgi:hypothetical protein